jgi:hypothetical protein
MDNLFKSIISKSVIMLLLITLSLLAQSKWTKQYVPDGRIVMGLAWTGHRIIAACDSMPAILVSTDGVEWTQVSTGGGYSVAGHDSVFVVDGSSYGGCMVSSDEGMTWTLKELEGLSRTCVTWCNNRFVLAGWGDKLFTSSDGSTWATYSLSEWFALFSIAWTGTRYVAVGGFTEPVILISDDAETWVKRNAPIDNTLRSIAWAGSLYTVGEKGSIWSSPNGYTWLPQESPTAASLFSVSELDSMMYITGDSGVLLSSRAGIHWERQQVDSIGRLYCCTFTGTQFIVGGEMGIYTSPKDGVASTVYGKPVRPSIHQPTKKQSYSTHNRRAHYNTSAGSSFLLSGRRISVSATGQKKIKIPSSVNVIVNTVK